MEILRNYFEIVGRISMFFLVRIGSKGGGGGGEISMAI